jgi:hypothetical protein
VVFMSESESVQVFCLPLWNLQTFPIVYLDL